MAGCLSTQPAPTRVRCSRLTNPVMLHIRPSRFLPLAALAIAAACGDVPTQPGRSNDGGVFQGFDTSIYPGDATMRAWMNPASPYVWSGYYLPAPCHHDVTWSGRRSTLQSMGWGIAAIYVGQQTWEGLPDVIPYDPGVLRTTIPDRALQIAIDALGPANATAATCSRTLLTTAQGTTEGDDAAARMAAEGFAFGSTVYLDVEYMNTVTQEIRDYVAAWVAQVLRDGRYSPGIYMHKHNAAEIRAAALNGYSAAGRTGEPMFWIASSTGFARTSSPTATGLSYADVWQGILDISETWNGATTNLDVNVSLVADPSGSPGGR